MTLRAVIVSLLSSDLERTASFYERLGFERSGHYPASDPDSETPTWIELRRDDVVVRFYSEPPLNTPDRPVLSGTIYITCKDVDALAASLHGAVDFEWGPETMDYGQREFAVRDPDGYLIAFAQPDGAAGA